jgi:hypothetical protein
MERSFSASCTPLTGQQSTMDIDSIILASTIGQNVDFDKLPTAFQIAGLIGAFIGSVVVTILGLRAKNKPPVDGATGGVAVELLKADVQRHEEMLQALSDQVRQTDMLRNDVKRHETFLNTLSEQIHDTELEVANMAGQLGVKRRPVNR